MKGRRDYLEIYLQWLKGKMTYRDLGIECDIASSTAATYVKFGRNLAITRYNKYYSRASKLKELKAKNNAFDQDLFNHLYAKNKI